MAKNLNLTTFPYRIDTQGNTFPVIPITLQVKDKNKKKEFFALIDSGATISVFRSDIANSLGLEVEKGKEVYLGGVGGRIKGYIHKLKVEIAGKKFILPIVFSHEYLVSFNLLGREAFFRRFKITFEEKTGCLSLE